MRVFLLKEAPGLYGAYKHANGHGALETVALFKTERDAQRFVEAANRSLTVGEVKAKLAKVERI